MQRSRISFPFLVGPAGLRPRAVLWLLLFVLALPAWAGTASLVADIDPRPGYSPGDPIYSPHDLHAVGNRALFFVLGQLWSNDGTPGGSQPLDTQECSEVLGTTSRALFLKCGFGFTTDLWASDGTSAGTLKLAATLSQPGGQSRYALTSDALFFLSCQGASCGLWKSDGTAKGTVLLRSGVQAFQVFDMIAVGRSIFYRVDAAEEELWTSDGTVAGTRKLATFPAASISSMVSAAGKLFFVTGAPADAAAPATANIALWVSDGTSGGTRKLAAFVAVKPTAQVANSPLPTDRLLLVADDGVHGFQVWTSDGTPAGTREVTRFADGGGEQVSGFGTVGRKLLFNTQLRSQGLYVSGGTPETTVLLAGCVSTCPIYGSSFLALGARTLFVGYADYDHRDGSLWVTDGTGPGTRKLGGKPAGLVGFAGKAYFRDASGAVWRTDGTPSGTVRIAGGSRNLDLFEFPFEAAAASDRIYFLNDAGFGFQLWSSTGAMTRALTTFNEDGVGSFPFGLVPFSNGVIFSACNDDVLQLWTSGGTAATTRPATTAIDSCRASDFGVFNPSLPVDGRVFYIGKLRTLWRTDGTPAGTSELTLPSGFQLDSLAAFGGRLLATVTDGAGQDHFFTNDGTSAGTVELFTLPEPLAIHGSVQVLGPRFYFSADPPGSEGPSGLWVSDGTTAGTHRLADLDIGAGPNPPVVSYQGSDYFDSPLGLWRTDGTPQGTVQILTTNGVGNPPLESISDLTVAGGFLFFFGEQRPERQEGLYRTDGTAAGTVRLKTLSLAHPLDGPAVVEAFGHLFFTADDGAHGVELWKADGSKTGTALVADLAPGTGSSHPGSLTATSNLLFFNADDGEHGAELWQTDGTAAGTRLVDDINPGSPPSDPEALTVAGNRLFFRADDGITGDELWSYPLDEPSCQPSATALCLAGGRFRVEAHWRTLTGNGPGQAVALTPDTGYFWFFDPANVEVILKVLDGRSVNQHFWVFYGALSDVDYDLTVTDTVTGATRRYTNPPGNLASVADTTAFGPLGANAAALLTFGPAPSSGSRGDGSPALSSTAVATPCVAGPSRLCLNGGRFAVTAS